MGSRLRIIRSQRSIRETMILPAFGIAEFAYRSTTGYDVRITRGESS